MTVYCEDCDHVHPDTRKHEPWRWRCMKAPIDSGYKFLSRSYAPSPPYDKCEWINDDGECEMFSPARIPPAVPNIP